MKKLTLMLLAICCASLLCAGELSLSSPDRRLTVIVSDSGGHASYRILYDGITFLDPSPLGFITDAGDFTRDLRLGKATEVQVIDETYSLKNIKKSQVRHLAHTVDIPFEQNGKRAFVVTFSVGNNDVAFRYTLCRTGETLCSVVRQEATGFRLPAGSTTFLCPQSPAMGGFARTTPSYETPYTPDDTPGKNGLGEGYTFPGLFRIADRGWVLISETGVDSRYCAGRLLGHADGLYTIGFPQEKEFNGNGSSSPGITLPGQTPWRTLTVGRTLAPVVETTVAFDLVEPLYEPSKEYADEYGCGTWSWIIAGDGSMNYAEQKRYIDFCAEMGYRTVLVDAWWDTRIGYEGIEELAAYARTKGVGLYLWYNSNGYWNDAPQGPRGKMHNLIRRRREMKWLQQTGIKGIKVDFFGSDKQAALQLYEEILADANDYGLLVIFHGCTLPRGWERMYPNYAASEAVLASENMNFTQSSCDAEAFNACLHPFLRNTVGSMDFGGSTLNRYYNAGNRPGGSRRVTSEVFALATAILFQSPVQHFALAPNNLTDAPAWAIDFMKGIPTTWDDTRFLDGYPGKYILLARRHGDTWYVVGANAQKETVRLTLDLSLFEAGETVTVYDDNSRLEGRVRTARIGKRQQMSVTIPTNGGGVIHN